MNVGVTTSRRTVESDESYTPFYAVRPLLQFIELYAREREREILSAYGFLLIKSGVHTQLH